MSKHLLIDEQIIALQKISHDLVIKKFISLKNVNWTKDKECDKKKKKKKYKSYK